MASSKRFTFPESTSPESPISTSVMAIFWANTLMPPEAEMCTRKMLRPGSSKRMLAPLVTPVTCGQPCGCDIKTGRVRTRLLGICVAMIPARGNHSRLITEEAFEFHQLRSSRDQLQDRLLRRRVGRQDDESAIHLSEDRR